MKFDNQHFQMKFVLIIKFLPLLQVRVQILELSLIVLYSWKVVSNFRSKLLGPLVANQNFRLEIITLVQE